MLEFRVLGSIQLRDSQGRELATPLRQPRQIALLSYLAAGSHVFHRRDTLVALFWPDLHPKRARSALSQAVYRLRGALGTDAIVARGREEVGVSESWLWCDAAAFRQALARGHAADALDLYRGDFLSGFHLSGAPDFERWLESERAELRRDAWRAARAAADSVEADGNAAEAAHWLRRTLAVRPDDEAVLRRLMALLDRTGDRAGALATYDEFVRALARDFGLEPASETKELARAISTSARRASGATSDRAIGSIAVLPFQNLGAAPAEEYFADGMTESLITTLGGVRALRVISHRSVLRFKASDRPLPQIAAALGVDAVVEGSVLRAGERVRITAQLIRAQPESHLWASSYDRDVRDVLNVHAEVAAAIVREIRLTVTAMERRRLETVRQVDPSAYEAFLKGRYYSATLTGAARGLECFGAAIERDPTYAPAYAGMAMGYGHVALIAHVPPAVARPRMEAAARKALAFDEELSEGHTALALYHTLFDWDWTSAEREYRRALDLNPSSSYARAYRAAYLCAMGTFDEAISESRQAVALDPLDSWTNFVLGWVLYRARRYDESVRQLDDLLQLHPQYVLAHIFRAENYVQMDRPRDAIEECRKAIGILPKDPLVLGVGAAVLALAGERAEGAAWARTLEVQARDRYINPNYPAAAFAALGDTDRAFEWWEKMWEEGSTNAFLLKTDPLFDCVRSDPRFEQLLRRLRL